MIREVGLDYDDVIANSSDTLSAAALDIYGFSVAANHFRYQESEVLDAMLRGKYEDLKDEVYLSVYWTEQTPLILGAKEGIAALLAANHHLVIVTNRSPDVSGIVTNDLRMKLGFEPPEIRFVGRKVCKRTAVEELKLDAFVDDSVKKLITLRGLPCIRNLICFTDRKMPPDITAINNWPKLVEFLNKGE